MSKKSLENARREAMQLSSMFPPKPYRVMDKKGEKSICTGLDWVYRERIMEGWNTVAVYINGREVKHA